MAACYAPTTTSGLLYRVGTRNAPTYVTNNELEQFSSVLRKQALVTLRSLATRPALKACVFKQSRVLQFFFLYVSATIHPNSRTLKSRSQSSMSLMSDRIFFTTLPIASARYQRTCQAITQTQIPYYSLEFRNSYRFLSC